MFHWMQQAVIHTNPSFSMSVSFLKLMLPVCVYRCETEAHINKLFTRLWKQQCSKSAPLLGWAIDAPFLRNWDPVLKLVVGSTENLSCPEVKQCWVSFPYLISVTALSEDVQSRGSGKTLPYLFSFLLCSL